MVNIEIMSDNIVLLINEIIKSQEVVKYLSYNNTNPLSQPDVKLPAKNLVLNRIHPYPFDPLATEDEVVEIRVYYPRSNFELSGAVAQTVLYIDIVCAKSLWLVNDGKSAIRPYMIASELQKLFSGRSIGTLGTFKFAVMEQLSVNDKFEAIRLHVTDAHLFGSE